MGTWAEKVRAAAPDWEAFSRRLEWVLWWKKENKQLTINGKEYLLELPLSAEFAFIKGYRGDKIGNVQYRGVSINSNKIVAAAAKYTVAEVNEITEIGDIDPNLVGTPGIYVQAVVQGYTFAEHTEVFNNRWESINALKKKK